MKSLSQHITEALVNEADRPGYSSTPVKGRDLIFKIDDKYKKDLEKVLKDKKIFFINSSVDTNKYSVHSDDIDSTLKLIEKHDLPIYDKFWI